MRSQPSGPSSSQRVNENEPASDPKKKIKISDNVENLLETESKEIVKAEYEGYEMSVRG